MTASKTPYKAAYKAKGSVDRRCSCQDAQNKLLGNNCPKLARGNHGQWYWRLELPEDAEGRRRPRRRSGFDSHTAAQAELDWVRALLALPQDGDDAALCTVGDLIAEALHDKRPLPETDTVRQLLRAGVTRLTHPSVGQWLAQWLAAKKDLAPGTHRSYTSHIRLYLDRYLGTIRLDKLQVHHVCDMFDDIVDYNDEIAAARASGDPARAAAVRYRRPVRASTMQRIRATLRTALNDAISEQLITFNPAKWVKLPAENRPPALVWTPERVNRWKATGVTPSPVMVWTPAQTGQFLDRILGDRLYALFHLVAHCGLRRGEACGLRWIDTDLTPTHDPDPDPEVDTEVAVGTIHVLNQIVQLGWATDQTAPKTHESMSTVALDPATTIELIEHRVRQDLEHHTVIGRGGTWIESGLVFTDTDGDQLHPAAVTARFHTLLNKAGLPPIRLHDLRHGAATTALAAGVDMKVVQAMLRHANLTTTSNLYTSVLPQVAHAAAADIAAAIPRKPRPTHPTPIDPGAAEAAS
ncbi:MAG TPA: tyrosine-type recombinase/integrase [Pseudonocardiaceae bacterium]|nr:tyrosine-type recombinase/integrase [Pseudonocardiaceae bacterium]